MYVRSLHGDVNNKVTRSKSNRMIPGSTAKRINSSNTNNEGDINNVWSVIALQQHWTNQLGFDSTQAPHRYATGSGNDMNRDRIGIITNIRAPRAIPRSKQVLPRQERAFSLKHLRTNKSDVKPAEEIVITAPNIHGATRHYTSKRAIDAAVKLGLVELPISPNDEDWERVVATQQARLCLPPAGSTYKSVHGANSSQRDSRTRGYDACSSKEYTCSICLESFLATSHSEPQVILDCSHVFHRACLTQFEKFLRRAKQNLSCPLCRKHNYYKRSLVEGPKQLQCIAAVKIQARIRGFLARKRILILKVRSDPKFATEYALTQLKEISDLYLSRAVAREKEVDEIIEKMDLERQIALAEMMSDDDWDLIRNRILTRSSNCNCYGGTHGINDETVGEEGVECPICLGDVVDRVSGVCVDNAVMLSCSHFFHEPCLKSFERLTVGDCRPHRSLGDGTSAEEDSCKQKPMRCPVCRSGYAKRPLL
eukprot:Tbor_TRINITY_DN3397_c0_g1::TRINITY_DN3397_c0_g1_i1::g.23552::m.23552